MTNVQAAQSLLMVRPTTFGFDSETAQSNAFQHHLDLSEDEIRQKAITEFETAVKTLRLHGIDVVVFDDPSTEEKPNAVFPNNWLSTWPNGTVYLYPMATASRRSERSQRAVDLLGNSWQVSDVIDLSPWEYDKIYLESTGVMIFDHIHKLVYACVSPRCNDDLFLQHAEKDLDYTPLLFRATDEKGTAIYHTNVLMSIQSHTAVICLEAVTDLSERRLIEKSLRNSGRDLIVIAQAQMSQFCGNVLEVQNAEGKRYIVMSQTAYDAFTPEQRKRLSAHAALLPISIPTIETIGGGSARCMLAEIFLPKR